MAHFCAAATGPTGRFLWSIIPPPLTADPALGAGRYGALTVRVEDTKTGVPLALPITKQFAAILEHRRTAASGLPEGVREWMFPSPTSATGHVQDPHHLYARIAKAGGAKFCFHGLRNSFITVAERELMLPPKPGQLRRPSWPPNWRPSLPGRLRPSQTERDMHDKWPGRNARTSMFASVSPEPLYQRIAENGVWPKTSCPNSSIELFSPHGETA